MTTCTSSRYSLCGAGCCVLGWADCFNFHESLVTQVEERQFQGYANKVIAEAESRGANTQPLRKAAKAGAGQ